MSDKQEKIMNAFFGISKENNNAPHRNAVAAKNPQNYLNIFTIGGEEIQITGLLINKTYCMSIVCSL